MSTRQKRRKWWNGLVVPAICSAVLGYFVYHAQTGRYSIYTREEMNQEALRLEFRLADLRAERHQMEKRVSQLTIGTLERDALDEVARRELGYIGENEIVIFH